MTSLVVPGAVQVRLHWTMNGADAYNVIGGSVGGGFANSQAVADALDAAIKGHLTSTGLAALLAATTSLVSVGIRDIRVANEAEFVGSNAAVPGTGGGNPLPNEVAATVTLRTARAGKSFRGRMYFGGFIVGENTGTGQISAALNTTLVSFVQAMNNDMSAQGITPAIVSRKLLVATPVTGVITRDTLWDSQRRRKS
jgi:hypothetical protein